ncbi:hypothetical protein KI387_034538 [Taxus chinensis]|uniref:Uncharacterized protein n=1 Tax=Taxus chinensis TaxID=29808 RepID=A0AA38BXQ0_TAXCH|nr:hypothetical protein KI387_034538 [Taxus chinensis]
MDPNRPVWPKSVKAVQNKVGQVEQKYPNRPNRVKWEQTVQKQMGHLGQIGANRPVRPKSAQRALYQKGQRDAWDAKTRRIREPIKS